MTATSALVSASVPVDYALVDVFSAAQVRGDDLAWLDSAVGHPQRGRQSILALELEPALRVLDGVATFTALTSEQTTGSVSWSGLDRLFRRESRSASRLGWLGYVAYEAAALFDPALEALARPLPYPELRFDRVRAALVASEAGVRLEVSGLDEADAHARLRHWLEQLSQRAPGLAASPLHPLHPLQAPDGERHRANVAALRQRIGEGRVYQACYTYPIRFRRPESLVAHYLALRAASPGDYGAYLRMGNLEVASSSPERFFRLEDRRVECRPMKGTRGRSDDPLQDAEVRTELATSEKDRAENVMIVDLMRNDIGRVCEIGTVEVPSLYDVETYSTVHQLTSTVVGTLRQEVGVFQLLEAVFPPGSMTGAPKVAACGLLRELEFGPRGLYSGTIGWMGYDGRAEFSVVIRTLQTWGDEVRWNVGGGIVWDSTPEGEWEESEQKAEALRRAGLA